MKRICRVCGKEYEACRSAKIDSAFRWQEVACSPECGAEYLHRIELSRGLIEDNEAELIYNEEINGFDEDDEAFEEYAKNFGADE